MRRDTGRPSLPAPLIEEVLQPGPASYSPSDALVRPRVPTLDLSAGCGRSDALAPPLVPEGDVLLLQPAHTLVERSARAVDFASAAPRAPPVSLAPTLTPKPCPIPIPHPNPSPSPDPNQAAPAPLPEGDVLALQPCPDAVLPSHPSLVKLPPRRRVRTLIHTLAHALTRA